MSETTSSDKRELPLEAAATLPPGANHYRAFVGPPAQFDFMGATQFRLLTALGLREHHTVLDFGCGSLRAGRLLIPYLLPGRYFGLEPNRWLIEDAIRCELGFDIIAIKRPTFRYDADFDANHFGQMFDYIIAQSIFSHCGRDLIETAMKHFRTCLAPGGLILATFVRPAQLGGRPEFSGTGWIYPGCVAYDVSTIVALIASCGLSARVLPWFHPRQTWFAIAHSEQDLPLERFDGDLTGRVVRGPEIR